MKTTVCTLAAFFALGCCSGRPSALHVADPYAHAIAQSYGTSLMRLFIDLNDDGVKELFVGSVSDSGSGGQGWHIYQKTPRDYTYLGYVFGERIKLEKTKHRGYHDLTVFWRMGGGEVDTHGNLITFRWNGSEYATIAEKHDVMARDIDWTDPGWLDLLSEEGSCPDYLGGNRVWQEFRR